MHDATWRPAGEEEKKDDKNDTQATVFATDLFRHQCYDDPHVAVYHHQQREQEEGHEVQVYVKQHPGGILLIHTHPAALPVSVHLEANRTIEKITIY